jgi:hypothetical protein
MKPWILSLAVLGVLGVGSVASAQYPYMVPAGVPAPAVYYAPVFPAAPMYVYRPAAVVVYRPAVVAAPFAPVAPAAVYPAPAVYPGPVYPAPVLVRAKVYYPGQPVRNTIRAALPY